MVTCTKGFVKLVIVYDKNTQKVSKSAVHTVVLQLAVLCYKMTLRNEHLCISF